MAAWRRSGQAAEEFARRRDLHAPTLKWWAWRLDRPAPEPDTVDPALRLVPVEVVDADPRSPTWPVEDHTAEWSLELRSGVVLRSRGALPEALLRAILRTVRVDEAAP